MMDDPATESDVTSSHASHLRAESVVLSAFPWTTDFLVRDTSSIITEDRYFVYMESIARLEEEIYQAKDTEGTRLQGALAGIMPKSDRLLNEPNLDKHVKHRVCELLCAYRLIDILYDLQDPKALSSYERPSYYAKQRVKEHLPSKHHKAVKALENVQLAACHLACMFVGTAKRTDHLAIPNFPSDAGDWDPNEGLTENERTFLHHFIKATGIQKIRHPLYGALLYSPLYLLTPNKLTANSWDQKNMLMLAKALGNNKPAILVTIERSLWTSLLSIASGNTSVHKALNDFFDQVPWDDIAMVSDADRAYFADDASLPDQKMGLISFTGEANLPASWPLARLRLGGPSSSSLPQDDPMELDQSAPITPPADTRQQVPLPARSADTQNIPVPTTAIASSSRHEAPSQYKSERLRDLDKAGKIRKFDEKKSQPKHKNVRKGPVRKAKPGPAIPSRTPRVHEFMPFQEVEKGVFIQQVRVKTFEFKE